MDLIAVIVVITALIAALATGVAMTLTDPTLRRRAQLIIASKRWAALLKTVGPIPSALEAPDEQQHFLALKRQASQARDKRELERLRDCHEELHQRLLRLIRDEPKATSQELRFFYEQLREELVQAREDLADGRIETARVATEHISRVARPFYLQKWGRPVTIPALVQAMLVMVVALTGLKLYGLDLLLFAPLIGYPALKLAQRWSPHLRLPAKIPIEDARSPS